MSPLAGTRLLPSFWPAFEVKKAQYLTELRRIMQLEIKGSIDAAGLKEFVKAHHVIPFNEYGVINVKQNQSVKFSSLTS